LEDFLVEVARKVLQIISENITFPRLIKATNIAGDADYFAIIGEEGRKRKKTVKIGKKTYPLAVISNDNTINVTIGSWLAYTKQQRQQELKDLYTSGVIDQRTLLEHLEFGDIDNIITRTRHEAIIKKRRELQQMGQPTDVTEEELALAENRMLVEGNTDVTAMPNDDHEVHISIHSEDASHDLVKLHIDEHNALLNQSKGLPPEQLDEEQMKEMISQGTMKPVGTQGTQGIEGEQGIGMPENLTQAPVALPQGLEGLPVV